MNVITRKQFENIDPLNGIFVFLNGESCRLCDGFLGKLKGYNTKDWTAVLLSNDDMNHMATKHLVIKVPISRRYVDGLMVKEIHGVLFQKQIRELRECI